MVHRRVVLPAIGSFLSGLAFATAAAPADIVKTRLMADSSYTGFLDCLGKSVRQGGVLSLYRGWTPVRRGSACSVWFACCFANLQSLGGQSALRLAPHFTAVGVLMEQARLLVGVGAFAV